MKEFAITQFLFAYNFLCLVYIICQYFDPPFLKHDDKIFVELTTFTSRIIFKHSVVYFCRIYALENMRNIYFVKD